MSSTRHTFAFDAAGRRVSMGDPGGLTTWTFDALGRVRTVNNWFGRPLTLTHDAVGNRTQLDGCDGHRWYYTADAEGRVVRVANTYDQTNTIAYDPLGREIQRVLACGTTVERSYDAAGREVLLRSLKSDGSALACYTATYDPAGNGLAVEELDGSRVTYTHDPAYQLVGEARSGAHGFAMTLTFDAVGNRTSKADSSGTTTYQFNAANELTLMAPPSGAPTTSSYDANGNLALEVTGSARTTMTWDGENRLTKLEPPDGTEQSCLGDSGAVVHPCLRGVVHA